MAKRPPSRTQQASSGRLTKAERREQARRERQELIRKAAIRRKRRRLGTIIGAVIVAAAVAGGVVLAVTGGGGNGAVDPRKLPGMLTLTEAPWPANGNANQALTRADDIGLPAGGGNYHVHALLQVYINGTKETVPAGIGFCGSGSNLAACASMHTHDNSGIMHMEASRRFPFTMGDFFNVWGVLLTQHCIGPYCDGSGRTLRVYLNGKPYVGDPTQLPLTQHEDVVVTYGTAAQVPHPVPSTYSKKISPSCSGSC